MEIGCGICGVMAHLLLQRSTACASRPSMVQSSLAEMHRAAVIHTACNQARSQHPKCLSPTSAVSAASLHDWK